jgi:hypothetical protein
MPRWTEEARARQRELIREWKPWEQSTGPVTSKGKHKSARNWSRGQRGSMLKLVRMINKAARGE